MRAITHEETQALAEFARKNGRYWKEELRNAWMKAGLDCPLLHGLRNTHGPSWLVSYRLPRHA